MAASDADLNAFLTALARHGSVKRAAAEAGLDRPNLYRLRRQSPSFAADWDRAAQGAPPTPAADSPGPAPQQRDPEALKSIWWKKCWLIN
jgi:hypothetical protein